MSEAAAPVKKVTKPKKPAAHPPFAEMIAKAIVAIADKKGSSKAAIKKYILANFKVEDNKQSNTNLNLALKKGVAGGKLLTAKGHAGTFKAAKPEKPKKVVKKVVKKTPKKAAKKPAAEKPAVKKVAKKPAAKKPAVKKTPAKKAEKKVVKKPAAKKTPKKVVNKPAAKKPAAKKVAPKKK